ncbi:hypothetical protein Nmel_010486 [Mimus melanotis]
MQFTSLGPVTDW